MSYAIVARDQGTCSSPRNLLANHPIMQILINTTYDDPSPVEMADNFDWETADVEGPAELKLTGGVYTG